MMDRDTADTALNALAQALVEVLEDATLTATAAFPVTIEERAARIGALRSACERAMSLAHAMETLIEPDPPD